MCDRERPSNPDISKRRRRYRFSEIGIGPEKARVGVDVIGTSVFSRALLRQHRKETKLHPLAKTHDERFNNYGMQSMSTLPLLMSFC